eukprot:17460-Heterococcus_DN1.PRE.2
MRSKAKAQDWLLAMLRIALYVLALNAEAAHRNMHSASTHSFTHTGTLLHCSDSVCMHNSVERRRTASSTYNAEGSIRPQHASAYILPASISMV